MKLKVLLSPKAAREAAQVPVLTIARRIIEEHGAALAMLAESEEWDRAAHQRCCN